METVVKQNYLYVLVSCVIAWVVCFGLSPHLYVQAAGVADGFAGMNGGTTGGAGGRVVKATTGAEIQAAINSLKNNPEPLIVEVTGTITPANSPGLTAIGTLGYNNITIVGVGVADFNGIGIKISDGSSNIIIENLKIHEVATGPKDAIGIEGPSKNIWIHHNELYGNLTKGKDDYDGLIDTKRGAQYITISYNYFHSHHKANLNGYSDGDTEGNRYITLHHNVFENIGSRTPSVRFGEAHVYNNYYSKILVSGVNSRMGARLKIENNHFKDSVNPIVSIDSSKVGYWDVSGNTFENISWENNKGSQAAAEKSTVSYSPPYTYTLDSVTCVAEITTKTAGVGKNSAVSNGNCGTTTHSITPPVVTTPVVIPPVVTPPTTPVSTVFRTNQTVMTTDKLRVREIANGIVLQTKTAGTVGVVIDGPLTRGGYNWWNINYATGKDGWSAENYLRVYDGTIQLPVVTTPVVTTPVVTPPVTTSSTPPVIPPTLTPAAVSGLGTGDFPTGFSKCADEGEKCEVDGTGIVAFGSKGSWIFKQITVGSKLTCNKAPFGSDPNKGRKEKCSFQRVANSSIVLPPLYVSLTTPTSPVTPATPLATTSVPVTSPLTTTPVTPTESNIRPTGNLGTGDFPSGFSKCADENENCNIKGSTGLVAYGHKGVWFFKKLTVGETAMCVNSVFGGDPNPGKVEKCSYQK